MSERREREEKRENFIDFSVFGQLYHSGMSGVKIKWKLIVKRRI